MADLPARLPRTEAELADWSVYADQLLLEGDRLGEMLASELALPARPTSDQIEAFKRTMRPRCWSPRSTMQAGWAFGHLRELFVWIGRASAPRQIDEGTLGNLRDMLRSPIASRLERIEVVTWWTLGMTALRRTLAALPASCTCVASRIPAPLPHAGPLARIADFLPPHVTELVLEGTHGFDFASQIDDRLAVVELPSIEPVRAQLGAILGRTSRVRLRVRVLALSDLRDRIELCDGAGLVETKTRRAHALPPPAMHLQQEVFGTIPVRSQLARTTPEHYDVRIDQGQLRATTGVRVNRLMKHDGTWTLLADHRDHERHLLDGRALPPGVHEVHDSSRITFGTIETVFLTHDFATRAEGVR
ncbi:MAG TPA: hypothetical protein VGC41_26245 [Kofleriaceae bacterium]